MSRLPERPDKTDFFNCEPHEIYALRKALGLSRAELGNCVGATLDLGGQRCKSVANWERGNFRPMRAFRIRLVQLAEAYKDEYLRIVKRYSPGPKQTIFVPYRNANNIGWSYRKVTPEMQERLREKSRSIRLFEPRKVYEKAGKAAPEAKPAA